MPKKKKRKKREDYKRLAVGNRRQTVYTVVFFAAGRKGRPDPRCPDRLTERGMNQHSANVHGRHFPPLFQFWKREAWKQSIRRFTLLMAPKEASSRPGLGNLDLLPITLNDLLAEGLLSDASPL